VIRLGRFSDGMSHFSKAEQTARQHNLSQSLIPALNALGWVCRLMGRIEEAASHYREALKLSLDLGDEWRQAWLTNNLGYVYALQRNRDTALRLCRQALDLWKKVDFSRGIGAVYSTLGEVSAEFNELDDAIGYFGQALDIFEPAQDFEWLSTTYCGRGSVFWLKGELDKAQQDLEKARDIGLKRDEPVVLHRLAHVCLERKNIEGAKDLFEQSRQVSQSAPDPFYELNSLGDLAKIAVLEGDIDKRGEFVRGFLDFQKRHTGIRYRLPEGLLHRYLGDLYLCAGEIEQAVDYYRKGLPLIAQAGSYEPYTITGQLADMEATVLHRVDPEAIADLAQRLEQYWIDEEYEETCPEVLPFFARWKTWTVSQGEKPSE
jgi:tetratricopeptide (TPR) repeat protein